MGSAPLGEGTLLDRTICHALRLAGDAVREELRCASRPGVEFWTQRRSQATPMQLHWDCNEQLGRVTGLLECPLLSVIVYAADEGGPTLMIGRSPADAPPTAQAPGAAERCWLVWPHAGQVAAFPGAMLHGVLPMASDTAVSSDAASAAAAPDATTAVASAAAASAAESTAAPDAPAVPPAAPLRETILLNFWARRPMDLPALPKAIAPRLQPELPPEVPIEVPESVVAGRGEGGRPQPARPAVARGEVRCKEWRAEDCLVWPTTKLALGMYDRTERWETRLPPIVYRQTQIESFASKVDFVAASNM